MNKFINVRDLNELYSLHQNEPVGTFAEILRSGPDNLKGFSIKSPQGWTSVYYYNSPQIKNLFANGIIAEGLSKFYDGIIVRENPNDNFLGFSSYITYLNTDYTEKKVSILDDTISFQKVTEEVNDFTPGGQFIPQGASSIDDNIYLIILKGSTVYYENYYYKFTDEFQTTYTLTKCVIDPFYPNHYCFSIISGTYADSNPVYYILTEKTYATIPNLTVEQNLSLNPLDTYNLSVINEANIDLNGTGVFNVIGATDIDLGFTGEFKIDANNVEDSLVTIDNVDNIVISADAELSCSAIDATITASTVTFNTPESLIVNGGFTPDSLFKVHAVDDIELTADSNIVISADTIALNMTEELNITGTDASNRIKLRTNNGVSDGGLFGLLDMNGQSIELSAQVDNSLGFPPTPKRFSKLTMNAGQPSSSASLTSQSNHLNGTDQQATFALSDGGCSMGISGSNGQLTFGISSTILPGLSSKAYFNDSRSVGSKFGIEYSADYSATLKTNARSLIDAGTMTVMLEDYIAAVPTYADNAAAVVGGLAVGKMYKTATGELRIVI